MARGSDRDSAVEARGSNAQVRAVSREERCAIRDSNPEPAD
jgi:hypothetical protein